MKNNLINYQLLEIDGCIEVNNCIDLVLTETYTHVNDNYFYDKKNILIYQKNQNGRLIDFIVFKPDTKAAFFIQAIYKITFSSVSSKSVYLKETKSFVNKFKKVFGIELKNIYLLYISSFIYNIMQKEEVYEILKKRNKLSFLFCSKKIFFF